MNCANCGKRYGNNLNFCPFCGAANQSPGEPKKKGGGLVGFWKGMPVFGRVLLIAGVVAIVVIVIVSVALSGGGSDQTAIEYSTSTTAEDIGTDVEQTPATQAPANTTFEQVGVHDAPALLVESYYVANPTKSAIEAKCEEKRKYYENIRKGQNIVLNFYDDMAHTPNYTQGWNPDDPTSEPCYICCYSWDRDTPTGSIDWYKEIPE